MANPSMLARPQQHTIGNNRTVQPPPPPHAQRGNGQPIQQPPSISRHPHTHHGHAQHVQHPNHHPYYAAAGVAAAGHRGPHSHSAAQFMMPMHMQHHHQQQHVRPQQQHRHHTMVNMGQGVNKNGIPLFGGKISKGLTPRMMKSNEMCGGSTSRQEYSKKSLSVKWTLEEVSTFIIYLSHDQPFFSMGFIIVHIMNLYIYIFIFSLSISHLAKNSLNFVCVLSMFYQYQPPRTIGYVLQ
jgi:hypothetical protein